MEARKGKRRYFVLSFCLSLENWSWGKGKLPGRWSSPEAASPKPCPAPPPTHPQPLPPKAQKLLPRVSSHSELTLSWHQQDLDADARTPREPHILRRNCWSSVVSSSWLGTFSKTFCHESPLTLRGSVLLFALCWCSIQQWVAYGWSPHLMQHICTINTDPNVYICSDPNVYIRSYYMFFLELEHEPKPSLLYILHCRLVYSDLFIQWKIRKNGNWRKDLAVKSLATWQEVWI